MHQLQLNKNLKKSNKIMKSKLLMAILLLSFYSCNDNISISQQRIFFEVHYINMAWGYTNQGLLIDSIGNIYEYNVNSTQSQNWNYPNDEGYISRAAMNKNFAFCNDIIHQISNDSLQYYVNKIDDAARGTLSKPVGVMADAGINEYIAYVYDKKKDSYKKVLIYQWGDYECSNNATAADELKSWLMRMEKYRIKTY